jgi:5-bromo-4-chloroindolyl phosphate hydrolysis protein
MSKAKPYKAKQPQALDYTPLKGTLLYLFLFPLFLAMIGALFQTNIQAFILNTISFFLFLSVVKIAKKGFTQEATYHQTIFTKAPKTPYKLYAGILLGGATFFTASIAGGAPLIKSLFLTIMSMIGFFLLYGFDPKEDKLENLGDISASFVLETLQEANNKLSTIKQHKEKITDTYLEGKIEQALQKANHIIRTIQEDPKDIRVARKFLIVYIDGIANVTNAYTELEEKEITLETKKRLYTLMDEVDTRLDKELSRLKNNNAFDLDVHIDVLKAQLQS